MRPGTLPCGAPLPPEFRTASIPQATAAPSVRVRSISSKHPPAVQLEGERRFRTPTRHLAQHEGDQRGSTRVGGAGGDGGAGDAAAGAWHKDAGRSSSERPSSPLPGWGDRKRGTPPSLLPGFGQLEGKSVNSWDGEVPRLRLQHSRSGPEMHSTSGGSATTAAAALANSQGREKPLEGGLLQYHRPEAAAHNMSPLRRPTQPEHSDSDVTPSLLFGSAFPPNAAAGLGRTQPSARHDDGRRLEMARVGQGQGGDVRRHSALPPPAKRRTAGATVRRWNSCGGMSDIQDLVLVAPSLARQPAADAAPPRPPALGSPVRGRSGAAHAGPSLPLLAHPRHAQFEQQLDSLLAEVASAARASNTAAPAAPADTAPAPAPAAEAGSNPRLRNGVDGVALPAGPTSPQG